MDIFDPQNYPADRVTDSTAWEWDAVGGDSLDGILQMCGFVGAAVSTFSIHLTRPAYRAACSDPTFRAFKSGMGGGLPVELSELRSYWGVKEVSVPSAVPARHLRRHAAAARAAGISDAGTFLILNVAA